MSSPDRSNRSRTYKIRTYFKELPSRLLDPTVFSKFVSVGTYIILSIVSAGMTVVNILSKRGWLTLATAVFAVLCLLNVFLSLGGSRGTRVARGIFSAELLGLFTFFLLSGNPDGFSACWIFLVPPIGLTFYGRRMGSVFCTAMLAVTIFLFWTPLGQTFLLYDYNHTFMARFPLLYCAAFALAYLLESLRMFYNVELLRLNKAQKDISMHDQLTGALNRVGLYNALKEKRDAAGYRKIGVAIIDLDFFKRVNDTYGHSAGDFVLREFSKMMQKYVKAFVCRWGGEEFALVYYDDDVHRYDLDFLLREVENRVFIYEKKEIRITVSMGVYEAPVKPAVEFKQRIKNADTALYRAKASGRNQIVYY